MSINNTTCPVHKIKLIVHIKLWRYGGIFDIKTRGADLKLWWHVLFEKVKLSYNGLPNGVAAVRICKFRNIVFIAYMMIFNLDVNLRDFLI